MCGAVAGPFPPGPSLPGSGWQEYSSQLKRREPGRRSARFTGRPVSRDEGGNGGDPYPARARGRADRAERGILGVPAQAVFNLKV